MTAAQSSLLSAAVLAAEGGAHSVTEALLRAAGSERLDRVHAQSDRAELHRWLLEAGAQRADDVERERVLRAGGAL